MKNMTTPGSTLSSFCTDIIKDLGDLWFTSMACMMSDGVNGFRLEKTRSKMSCECAFFDMSKRGYPEFVAIAPSILTSEERKNETR